MSKLNVNARGRKIIKAHDAYQIREGISTYNVFFDAKKRDIEQKNTFFGNDYV